MSDLPKLIGRSPGDHCSTTLQDRQDMIATHVSGFKGDPIQLGDVQTRQGDMFITWMGMGKWMGMG